ncbi:MAG: ParB N-terminal domain-containing protein [Candidatus Promineifilaceae bacterium]
MAKRKSALAGLDFKRVDPLGLTDKEAKAAVSGPAQTYHIESMLPDPSQPRALLPEALSRQVANGQLTPVAAMKEWERLASASGPDSPDAQLLARVKELAESIATHGLINAVTIRRTDEDDPVDSIEYRIVTGERRWWAHVYLVSQNRPIQEGHESKSAAHIKAAITAEGVSVRAHQLVENWFREDISVVEKAYGLWALRCEMSGLPFGNYSDRELVNWQDVEALLHIGRRQRRRIVRVLEMSEEAQAIVNGYRLSERSIRPIAMKLVDYPELQIKALNQVVAWIGAGEDYGERQVTKLVESLLAKKGKGSKTAVSTPTFEARAFRSRIRGAVKLVSYLETVGWGDAAESVAADEALAADLRRLRRTIDQILPE